MNFNDYYVTTAPIFYLERLGYSDSNTWVGSSRATETIYAGKQSRDGDEFHLLVGGDFLVRDGKATSIDFWVPKHLFEKSYGGRDTAKKLFAEFEKSGDARRIETPASGIDYAAGRSMLKFPDTRARLTYEQHSPTYEAFTGAGDVIRQMAREHGLLANFYDFHEERRALLQVTRKEGDRRTLVLEIKARENGDIYVRPNEKVVDTESFMDALRDLRTVDPNFTYETSFWARGMDLLENDVFLNELEGKFLALANGSAPRP
ncbi:hypothetical protein G6L37_00335 [Agrobacterium rubi]|nr:hypothetical protein [Agrobacterium rubi]NTF23836.1 hypothetical protein [Agrobacterium rubi]